ncbi:hypothetical protein ACVIGB_005294 [Bradyrhizobium sp. USDA 4341]
MRGNRSTACARLGRADGKTDLGRPCSDDHGSNNEQSRRSSCLSFRLVLFVQSADVDLNLRSVATPPERLFNEDRYSNARTRFPHYGAPPKPPATRRDWFQSSSSLPCSNHQRRNNKQQNNVKQELRDQVAITVEHYISHLHCPLFGRGRRADFASALGAFAPTNTVHNERTISPRIHICVVSASHWGFAYNRNGRLFAGQRGRSRMTMTIRSGHATNTGRNPRCFACRRTTAMRRLRDVCQQPTKWRAGCFGGAARWRTAFGLFAMQ